MKKTMIFLCYIVAALIFWIVLPTPDQTTGTRLISAQNPATPLPSPSVTLIKLDQNSNLSAEAKKIDVLDYSQDYQGLNQTLSQF